ncbi:hypothetical protein P171DRAFT_157437 [Karstenula rhodostoma CBS 690.94]|uniref:Uncharacterized protein n=1 Tax=Karstenula rhodostoma CBS 690.94 TaxID=1392251 RepID=A0A9P4P8V5_9PLEO|nr:hypothetical protein P171DRAFT_157437 [Karstenula rhodostoma CBS 690.94]
MRTTYLVPIQCQFQPSAVQCSPASWGPGRGQDNREGTGEECSVRLHLPNQTSPTQTSPAQPSPTNNSPQYLPPSTFYRTKSPSMPWYTSLLASSPSTSPIT